MKPGDRTKKKKKSVFASGFGSCVEVVVVVVVVAVVVVVLVDQKAYVPDRNGNTALDGGAYATVEGTTVCTV
jgi:hypothetical protein